MVKMANFMLTHITTQKVHNILDKKHWILHFKEGSCIVCELYLNKGIKKKLLKNPNRKLLQMKVLYESVIGWDKKESGYSEEKWHIGWRV
jgi:hypothetical protein